MNLTDFTAGVKQIIRGNCGKEALALANELPIGRTTKIFGVSIGGNMLRVIIPFNDLQGIFDIANKALPQEFYDYTIRVTSDGKISNVSKKCMFSTPITEIRKKLIEHAKADRTFYEIIKTDDFEITYSDYEGVIIKAEDEMMLKRLFQVFSGLFPYIDLEKDTKRVGVECTFEVEKYDAFKKEQKRKAKLSCNLLRDGKVIGIKGNTFIF